MNLKITPSKEDVEHCYEQIKALDIDFIRFEQVDFNGIARSKTVPKKHFKRYASKGLNVFKGTYTFGPQGSLSHGIGTENGYCDSLMFPDCKTLCKLPQSDKTARVYCLSTEISKELEPIETSPRYVCLKQLKTLEKDHSLKFRSAFEYEFIIVDKETYMPIVNGVNIFSTVRNNLNEKLIYKICRHMKSVGIDIITANTEYSPGQYEIVYAPDNGIRAADNASTFKTGIKEICQQENLIATFMTWPSIFMKDRSTSRGVGCGGHFNHSIQSSDSKNEFYDSQSTVADKMRYWIGGLIRHAPAIQAFFNQTTNCYKRISPNTFAPRRADQGNENRLASFRIKNNRPELTYIENRIPGSCANPYLVTAATIAAGMHGLKDKIEPPKPIVDFTLNGKDDDVYTKLPTSLSEALDCLEKDQYLIECLGSTFVEQYIRVKRNEIDQYNKELLDPETNKLTSNKDKIFEYEMSQYFEYMQ